LVGGRKIAGYTRDFQNVTSNPRLVIMIILVND
jgi:hypothetical protein